MSIVLSNRTLWFAGCRFIAALVFLLILSARFGPMLIDQILPVMRWQIAQLDDRYRILELDQTKQGPDSVVRLAVSLKKPVIIGEKVIHADARSRGQITIPSGHILQPWIIGLALLFAWPLQTAGTVQRLASVLMRLVSGVLLLGLITLIDMPFVMLAEIWDIFVSLYTPNDFSLLIAWGHFLDGGGRLAMGIVAGVIAIAVCELITPVNGKEQS